MMRAWIIVELNNGTRIKYVRDVINDTNGVATKYYAYTNEAGDQLANQTGAGKVLGDYNTIVSNASVVPTVTPLLAFPESTGSTATLKRDFYDQGIGRESTITNTIRVDAVSRVYLVEEWMNVDREL